MVNNWVMRITKQDGRCRSGWRAVSTTVWRNRTLESMRNEVRNLQDTYPPAVYCITCDTVG